MSRRLEALLLTAIVVLLAGGMALARWAGGRGAPPERELDFRASTLLSGPEGSRALFDVLQRLGVPVERRRSGLFDLMTDSLDRPGVLVVLDPPRPLVSAELAQLVRFAASGGAVVAAGRGGGVTRCAGWRLAKGFRFAPDTFSVAPPEPDLELPAVSDYLTPPTEEDRARERGVRGGDTEAADCASLKPVAQDTLLRLLDGRAAALRLRYRGGGSVTLVADVDYFRNRVWRATEVPEFVVPLLLPARRRSGWAGTVAWDEYHQGFAGGPSLDALLLEWLTRTPPGWALLQLIGVAIAWLAVAAVRFGPPRPVVERRRRSPLEHVDALAAGLEGAGGADTAVALVVGGLRRRLGRVGRTAARSATGDARQWLAALELALPSKRGRDAVRRLRQIVVQPGGPERALAAAQAVEDVWEELRPPSGRAIS